MDDEMTVKRNESDEMVFVVRLAEVASKDWLDPHVRFLIETGVVRGAEYNECEKYEVWRESELVASGTVGQDFG